MQLKLRQLQSVVDRTKRQEKSLSNLRNELSANLGPSIEVSRRNSLVLEAADERLDLLEVTNRTHEVKVKLSVLLEAAQSNLPIARKIAARLLPESKITNLLVDTSSDVRYAAAKRLPAKLVNEAASKMRDKGLRELAHEKMLEQATSPIVKVALGDPLKLAAPAIKDFTDEWYERKAREMCNQFGSNIERNWEEIAVSNLCSSVYATTGIKIDKDKLLSAVHDIISKHDEEVLDEGFVYNLSRKLLNESSLENDDSFMPVFEEIHDPISELVKENLSASDYIKKFESLTRVRKSQLPPSFKKYRLEEGLRGSVDIPVLANINTNSVVNEKAADLYVKHWNIQQSLRGEPLRLSWSPHVMDMSMIGFNLELK